MPAASAWTVEHEVVRYADAGHGFHCDERGSFHKGSADVAYERTKAFLAKHMKK